jgi:hypothetical protein
MAFISVTRLRLRSIKFSAVPVVGSVDWRTGEAGPRDLKATGQRDSHLTFWTLTAWTDERAIRAFMLSGAHQRVMPKLFKWCDEASVVHWSQETAELPSWSEAHRRMVADGRQSRCSIRPTHNEPGA